MSVPKEGTILRSRPARRRPRTARRSWPASALAGLAALVAGLTAPVIAAAPASADATSVSFTTPGAYTWTVPDGVNFLAVEAIGGAGGGLHPGVGGDVHALVPVRARASLIVIVGGQGSTTTGAGGYGGDGSYGINREGGDHGTSYGSGGGGGGTTVADALGTDLVVAGGGGGTGLFAPLYCGGPGGGAGTPDGVDGCRGVGFGLDDSNGKGATATAPGAGGQCVNYGDGGDGDWNYWGLYSTSGRGGWGNNGGGGGGGRHGGGGGCYDGELGGGGGGGSSYGPTGAVFGVASSAGDGSVTLTPVPLGRLPLRPSDHCTRGTIVDGSNGGVYTMLRVQPLAGPTRDHAWVCFRVDGGGVQKGGWVDVDPRGDLPGAGAGGGGITNDGHSEYCQSPPSGFGANTVPGAHPVSDNHTGDPGDLNYVREVFDLYAGTYTDPVTRARHDEAWACLTVTAGGRTDGYRVVINQASPSAGVSVGTIVTFYPDPGTL